MSITKRVAFRGMLAMSFLSMGVWVQAEQTMESASVEMPSRSGDFEKWVMASAPVIEPMVAVESGEASKQEDSELEKALFGGDSQDVFQRLGGHLGHFPRSRWRPVIELNLGHYYYGLGAFTKAIAHFRQAYDLSKTGIGTVEKRIADAAAAQLSRMYARLGRMEDLDPLLRESLARDARGASRQILEQSEEAWEMMTTQPGISFKCGPLALAKIREEMDAQPYLHEVIQEAQSPWKGFSLAEVEKMAGQMKMGLVGVKAPQNFTEIPVPSMVHWKLNHYAAIVKKMAGRYLVRDLTFGFDDWVNFEVLQEEASGYFIVSENSIPKGWKKVNDNEAWKVYGRGLVTIEATNRVTVNDVTSGGGICRIGMAGYTFYTMMASLGIKDVPLGYVPPVGPAIGFEVHYNQRETVQPATINFGHIGRLWGHNWSAWVHVPATNSLTATVALRGGGAEAYTRPSATNGVFASQSGARLLVTGTNAFERVLPNGSKEVYAVVQSLGGGQSRVFLNKVIDGAGNEVVMAYDGSYRLTNIADAMGKNTILTYSNLSHPYLVTTVTDPFGRKAEFYYDGSGQLTNITDVAGIASRFTYRSGDFVDSLTTPYGVTRFDYSTAGTNQRILTATDPLGGTEKLEANRDTGAGSMETPIDQRVSTNIAVGGGNVAFLVEANVGLNRYRNSFFWDKKAYATGADNRENAVLYHWLHRDVNTLSPYLESFKRPLESRMFFNYAGQSQANLEPSGAFIGIPSKTAQVVNVVGTNKQVALSQSYFNAIGKPTNIIDPLGRETVLTYATNLIDLVEVKQKKAGGGYDVLFSATYNSQHLPSSMTGADGATTTFGWNPRGQLTALTNALSEVTTYTYNTNGYLISLDPPLAGTSDQITLTYDDFGRVETRTQWGYTLTYDYDNLDRITKVTYPDGSTEEVIYEAMHARWLKDRKGLWSRRDVNAIQQVVGELNPAAEYTAYEWCKCGDLKAIIDAQGRATRWTHDVGGRKTSKKYADGRTDTYAYNAWSGWLETVTDAAGQQQKPEYALDGRVTAMRYVNETVETPDVTWGWDAHYPRLTNMVDGTGTTSYTYRAAGTNGAGSIDTVDGPLGSDTLTLDYDALGRVVSRTLGGVTQSTTYDALGRVVTVANPLDTFTVAYDGTNGLPQSVSGTNGLAISNIFYGATNDYRVAETDYTWEGTNTLAQFGYEYDVLGRITRWDHQVGSGDPRRVVPEYDRVSQLVRALTINPATSQQIGAEANRYDRVGNRLGRQVGVDITSATFNVVNQLQALTAGGEAVVQGQLDEPGTVRIGSKTVRTDGQNRFAMSVPVTTGTNQLTVVSTDINTNSTTNTATFVVASSGSRSFSYDLNGNTTDDGLRSYEWDGANRLVKINYSGMSNYTQFTYDGLSRRVRIQEVEDGSTVDDRRFVYDGHAIAEERAPDGTTVRKRFYAQGAFIFDIPSSTFHSFYYVRDHLGSIRAVVDEEGEERGRWNYSLWGSRSTNQITTDPVESDFGYTGHLEHGRSGLVFAPYRAYDPELGRWLSRDPIREAGGKNLYGYVSNDPVNLWDPLGLRYFDSQETIAIILQARTDAAAADIWRVLGNHSGLGDAGGPIGRMDFKHTGHTFEVPGRGELKDSEFGNYLAGFSGGSYGQDYARGNAVYTSWLAGWGGAGALLGGILFDFIDLGNSLLDNDGSREFILSGFLDAAFVYYHGWDAYVQRANRTAWPSCENK